MREATIYSLIHHTKLYIYFPDGGKWTRGYLKEVLGSRVQLAWMRDDNGNIWWMVAKSQRETLTAALQNRYDGVWVVRDYSTKQVCTTSCQRAIDDQCICCCGGEFHGGGGDWTLIKGDLLIGQEVRRIFRYFNKET